MSGILDMNICPIVGYSDIQMAFEYWTILGCYLNGCWNTSPVFKWHSNSGPPLEYWTLNSEVFDVWHSNDQNTRHPKSGLICIPDFCMSDIKMVCENHTIF